MELQGKVIVITGAGRGLGRATALRLATSGAKLALVSRNKSDLESLVQEIQKVGGIAGAFTADVRMADEVQQAVSAIEREMGPIEVVINSAGIGRYNPLELLTPGEIEEMIDTNLLGTILVTQAVYQRMRLRSSGLFIQVLSTAGREAKPRETAYCATKWGVMGFTRSLALESRKYGIRATAFCPGGMDTTFWDHEPSERAPKRDRFLSVDIAVEGILHILSLPEHVEIPEYAVRHLG